MKNAVSRDLCFHNEHRQTPRPTPAAEGLDSPSKVPAGPSLLRLFGSSCRIVIPSVIGLADCKTAQPQENNSDGRNICRNDEGEIQSNFRIIVRQPGSQPQQHLSSHRTAQGAKGPLQGCVPCRGPCRAACRAGAPALLQSVNG